MNTIDSNCQALYILGTGFEVQKAVNLKTYNLQIPSSTDYLEKVEQFSVDMAALAKLSESDSDDVAIVVTELVNNAIHHGNKDDISKMVYIECEITDSELSISIRDEGKGFDPNKVKDPLAPENLMSESGRGIFLIRNLMDGIDFNFGENGTEGIVRKNLYSGKTQVTIANYVYLRIEFQVTATERQFILPE